MTGGTVDSWLLHLTKEQSVRVQALARDIVMCSWTRHFTLSTQVYKWVPANLMLGGNPVMDQHPVQVASCYRNETNRTEVTLLLYVFSKVYMTHHFNSGVLSCKSGV